MNTKTMRLPPRRNLASNKRKERDDPSSDSYKPPPPPFATVKPLGKPVTGLTGSDKVIEPVGANNQLLAGYLAHEFLTKGTLVGQPWDPKEKLTLEVKKLKPSPKGIAAEPMIVEDKEKMRERYVEVSKLLKTKGPHLPGIVNPTQLARFLQM
ncbi:hypothetical protein LINGRAHAP2_LOCUS15212 [Linum grandiflorum]